MAQTIKEAILRDKLIVIMRGIFGENALKLVDALHENGINLFEVTFPQSDPAALEKTSELIEQLTKEFGSAVCMELSTSFLPMLMSESFILQNRSTWFLFRELIPPLKL